MTSKKKARGSARRLACSGPRHGGAPNKYGGGGGGGGAVVGGKEKKEGDGAGGTSAHGPDATRPEGGRGGRVPPRPRRSSQIRSAVWLVWSATGPRCRAVPCRVHSRATLVIRAGSMPPRRGFTRGVNGRIIPWAVRGRGSPAAAAVIPPTAVLPLVPGARRRPGVMAGGVADLRLATRTRVSSTGRLFPADQPV